MSVSYMLLFCWSLSLADGLTYKDNHLKSASYSFVFSFGCFLICYDFSQQFIIRIKIKIIIMLLCRTLNLCSQKQLKSRYVFNVDIVFVQEITHYTVYIYKSFDSCCTDIYILSYDCDNLNNAENSISASFCSICIHSLFANICMICIFVFSDSSESTAELND